VSLLCENRSQSPRPLLVFLHYLYVYSVYLRSPGGPRACDRPRSVESVDPVQISSNRPDPSRAPTSRSLGPRQRHRDLFPTQVASTLISLYPSQLPLLCLLPLLSLLIPSSASLPRGDLERDRFGRDLGSGPEPSVTGARRQGNTPKRRARPRRLDHGRGDEILGVEPRRGSTSSVRAACPPPMALPASVYWFSVIFPCGAARAQRSSRLVEEAPIRRPAARPTLLHTPMWVSGPCLSIRLRRATRPGWEVAVQGFPSRRHAHDRSRLAREPQDLLVPPAGAGGADAPLRPSSAGAPLSNAFQLLAHS